MSIGNQLEIYINRGNLEEAKEKIYKMLEGGLGFKEKSLSFLGLKNDLDIPDPKELNNTTLINFENSVTFPEKVVIVIKTIEADICINLYGMAKDAVKGL